MRICVQMMESEIRGTIGIALVTDLGIEIWRGIEDGAGVGVRNDKRAAREREIERGRETKTLIETGHEQ